MIGRKKTNMGLEINRSIILSNEVNSKTVKKTYLFNCTLTFSAKPGLFAVSLMSEHSLTTT